MHIKIRGKSMAKPGKKRKVLFVLEIIVLLLFIGGLYVSGFVGIGEYHQFFRRCGSALLCFEVFADRFAQHGMTEIFLPVQNIAYGGSVPTIRVYDGSVSAIFGRILCRICRGYQHLFFG